MDMMFEEVHEDLGGEREAVSSEPIYFELLTLTFHVWLFVAVISPLI